MKYENLTDSQLKKLLKIRIDNERAGITITKIKICNKRKELNTNTFQVSFIIYSKEWAPENYSIIFLRFYPNEFLFLQKCGVKF